MGFAVAIRSPGSPFYPTKTETKVEIQVQFKSYAPSSDAIARASSECRFPARIRGTHPATRTHLRHQGLCGQVIRPRALDRGRPRIHHGGTVARGSGVPGHRPL